jgi:hypothetical protein
MVLDRQFEEPFLDRPVANLAMLVIHDFGNLYTIETSE